MKKPVNKYIGRAHSNEYGRQPINRYKVSLFTLYGKFANARPQEFGQLTSMFIEFYLEVTL